MLYDVIIIGGGPAAVAAAVYTARKQMKTLLVAEAFGGQSIVSDDIQNWIGDAHVSGTDLAARLEAHVRAYPEEIEIRLGERVEGVKDIPSGEGRACDFEVKTNTLTFQARTLIVCSGARRRKLGVTGEENFSGKGVAYCSTCDAPLFKGKAVAVVGDGNAGLEAVIDLLPYAAKIYLLAAGDQVHGDPATFEKIKNDPRLEVFYNAKTQEIIGEKLVTSLVYADQAGAKQQLPVQGVFVEIGSVPNSEIVKDLVNIDAHGQIITDMKFATTSHPGVFAAGDVTDDPFKQNNISVGDGVRAALSAYDYLLKRQKQSPAADHHAG